MALPINIDELLKGKTVEWERLDFKQGWNPEDVMHSACAFANDIHNWGGGYIIIGISEKNGVPLLPPEGIDLYMIDDVQKDLVNICNQIQPSVNVLVEPVEVMGKMILVIYVPGGEVRPYKAPKSLGKESHRLGKVYYVRKGSVTKIADREEERILMGLCNKIPFDDRINHSANIEELDRMYIEDFLKRVGSKMTHDEIMYTPMAELGWHLQIIGGNSESLYPKNVGLLLFSQNPEKFFPYARIEIVHFLDSVGNRFTEKILHGPIHLQLEAALKYIREQVLLEKIIKVKGEEKAVRCYNYPYEALEEILVNSVFHKSWDDRNPIEVRINHESIEILNFEGPMPPITNADLKKTRIVSRNYRNRRIGDFLKEMHLTEGRSTGFPKIYQAVKRNGSPMPVFETDERNTHFLATIPIHPAFIGERAYIASIGKEMDEDIKENFLKDFLKDFLKESEFQITERQGYILYLLSLDNSLSGKIISEKISMLTSGKISVTDRTIRMDIADLQSKGILTREGGRKDGRWVISFNSKL
ncbi:MAG: putative DNA binding domain-containing protein [Muribaculaceae bacterium]|nr:putative DNA binding domain-containing protein [Muribaculaceae bacterium]